MKPRILLVFLLIVMTLCSSFQTEAEAQSESYIRYPDSISIVPLDKPSFFTGSSIQFKVNLLPLDTTETDVNWYAYGGKAWIDGNGKLTITDKGKVMVKAYTQDYKHSATYEFDAIYSPNHFKLFKQDIGVKQNKPIVLIFDAEIDSYSAKNKIFVTQDGSGNNNYMDVKIEAHGNKIYLSPIDKWLIGDIYIFIRADLKDVYGSQLGENFKYKFSTRKVLEKGS